MQRLGGSSCNLAETQRTRLTHEGLGKQPLLLSEKEARGSYKKPGELLTALSLRAEARGLFLQICQDPATQARTQGGAQETNPHAREAYKKLGELLIALLLRVEARGLSLQFCRDPAT